MFNVYSVKILIILILLFRCFLWGPLIYQGLLTVVKCYPPWVKPLLVASYFLGNPWRAIWIRICFWLFLRYMAISIKSLPPASGSKFFWKTTRVWGDHPTCDFWINPTSVDMGFAWIRKNIGCSCSGALSPVSGISRLLDLVARTPFKRRSHFKVS